MTSHPYQNLPDHCFWRPSVAKAAMGEVDPVVKAKFHISATDRVATAGSCFAQHIARHLQHLGLNYFVTEKAHPLVSDVATPDYNYGTYSARFGNLYAARQLNQLFMRAYGLFLPSEDCWSQGRNSFIDPFRPQIQPGGFSSYAELRADRSQHLAAVRRMVAECDVFIFTLGLTEAWVSTEDGAVFPICPGVVGGSFDAEKYSFRNFTAAETELDLQNAIHFIRRRNPDVRVILTVSPVPLVATFEDRSVLVSTAYSKAALRVAAENISGRDRKIAYFPSYEIITGNFSRGSYFDKDLRTVTEEGVSHVMRLFAKHYISADAVPFQLTNPQPLTAEVKLHADSVQQLVRTICDEEVLARVQEV